MYSLLVTGDVPGAATYFNPLLQQTVIPCTSGTRPSSPPEGMVIYQTDTDTLHICKNATGPVWKRYASDAETHQPDQDEDSTAISGVTSTSFIPGSPVVAVTFQAPPSGMVMVTVTGALTQSSNSNVGQLGWEMRAGLVVGSGSIIVGLSSDRSVATSKAVTGSGPAEITASNRYLKGSLTPGNDYHVYTAHRTTPAGTMGVNYRCVLVEPVL